MPIRINLLAEAHALEDLRRRDPVKRAIWVGGALVAVILAWGSSLQVKAMVAKRALGKIEAQLVTRTNAYQGVLGNQRKLAEVERKLTALQQLATNRLLYGTLLNGLQQSTIDDVQLVRFRADQSYSFTEEVKPRTNDEERVIPGRPATVTERIVLNLDARDSSPNPGDQVNKFKQALMGSPYFKGVLSNTNEVRLASLSPLQSSDNKGFVLFSLECRFPQKTR
jgi:hypothetical protein